MSRDIRAGRLSPEQLADQYADLHPRLTDHQAAVESNRCLYCHDAPCIEACPTLIDIPSFIRRIQTGNTRGAAMTILEANIMGATCSNVCPVEVLCEQACVRHTGQDRAVAIGRLQRYATDHLMERGIQPFNRAPDSGFNVAVIGAGPAGLACAHRLSRHGHKVTVFDAREKPGGLNEYGIAAYKMLEDRAAREVAMIVALGGIEIRGGQMLGRDFTLGELRQNHDAVFLGMGLGGANRLGLDGEDELDGVHDAVDYIARLRQTDLSNLEVGRRVVVIGGGSTAIDIAVQTRKLGAETVHLVYRRSEARMSATDVERQLARDNGVLIHTRATPTGFLADDGAVTGVEFQRGDESFALKADQVFKAIGQRLDPLGLPDELLQDGRISVDGDGRTGLDRVWAGGDAVAGLDLTVAAVADGQHAAESIHAELTGVELSGAQHG